MIKPAVLISLAVLATLRIASGKDLFLLAEPVETNKTCMVAESVRVEPGKKHELSFAGRTDSRYSVEENARIRLMAFGPTISHVRIRFLDGRGKELRESDIEVPVITRTFTNYVRVFYPPAGAQSLNVALLPGEDGVRMAVRGMKLCTDLQGKEAACINVHPVFEKGDLNFYGHRSGYGGGFYTRPDGKTIWNSGFTGATPAFPVKGNTFYDFSCLGKNGQPKAFIYLQCYDGESDKPFKTIKYGVSEKGAVTTFMMPAGAVSAQLTCYYVILEEFRVVESSRQE